MKDERNVEILSRLLELGNLELFDELTEEEKAEREKLEKELNSIETPNPGSKEAIKQGCICAVLDNRHGFGLGDGMFWITERCPLHDLKGKK